METTNILSALPDIEKEMRDLVDLCNELHRKDKLTVGFTDQLKKVVRKYAEKAKDELYNELYFFDKPVFEAINRFDYRVLVVRKEMSEGEFLGYYVTDAREVIKPSDFCKRAKKAGIKDVNADWDIDVSLFGRNLAIREASRIAKEYESTASDYHLNKRVAKFAQEATLLTDDELFVMFQNTLSSLYLEKDEDGNNLYPATIKDFNFMLDTYARKGSEPQTVVVSKDAALCKIFFEIYNSIVTERNYNVTGFRSIKQVEGQQAKLKAAREEKKAKEEAEKAAAEVKAIIETPLDFDFNFEPLGELESISATA